jgi:hypothetical protein
MYLPSICFRFHRQAVVPVSNRNSVCTDTARLDEPDAAYPVLIDFSQGPMTPPFWSEPMGVGAELRLQIGIQEQADNLLH